MRKTKRIGVITLIVMVVMISSLLLTACKPGYKEVWEPIAPYHYDNIVQNNDLEVIKSRINADCIIEKNAEKDKNQESIESSGKDEPNKLEASYILSKLQPDGSFEDIPYDENTEAYWPPLDHLKYVLFLQVARNDANNKTYYQSEEVKKAVTSAMKYWVEKDYKCKWNWWYNDVGVGMYLPNIILFGVDGLDDGDRNKMLSNIEGTLLHKKPMRFKLYERKCNEAGGNLADQALSTLKFCLAKGDMQTIMWVTKQIENELRPFPPYKGPKYHRWDAEGAKEDFSFQQHDQLIYFGGYGEVMLDGFNKYIKYTKGTQFELSDKALNFYADFILEGMQFATRNGFRDISASGRGSARVNGLHGIYENVRRTIDTLLGFDNIKRKADLERVKAERFGETDKGAGGHRYFYESDYNIYNGDKYMASVRHASDRTRIFEYLNGENPLAYYTGLGATFFYVDGDEYYNILPTYNWNKIPGTTTRQGVLPTMNQDFSYSTYGDNKYVMGVSNGNVGLSYMRLQNHGVNARKAYFMFEDGVVCLGADIWSVLGKEIDTNINQTLWKGDVVVSQNGKEKTLNSESNISGKIDYVYHNKIAYFTNNDIKLNLDKDREGDWKTINEKKKNSQKITNDIFTLDINHGTRPIRKTYDYTVLMNTSKEEAKAYKTNSYLKVVANTKNLQAVYDSKNGIYQAVFHKGQTVTLPDGKKLTLSDAAVIIIEKQNGGYKYTIASYDYNKAYDVEITLDGRKKTVSIDKRPKTQLM